MSYLFPIKIWKGSGARNKTLELFLNNGDWQLATDDAIYSDGARYRPLLKTFKLLKCRLPFVKKVLLLGSGIGSGVRILNEMGYYPEFVLVDDDKQVLNLAEDLLPEQKIKFVCADAEKYMEANNELFDLIVIDIFSGRVVPEFVSSENFIQKCRDSITKNGAIVMNYMLNSEKDKERFRLIQKKFLPNYDVVDIGLNKVLIATV